METINVYHQGPNNNSQLLFSTFDGTAWTPDQQVAPGVALSDSPSPVMYQNKLLVFHQGAGNSGKLFVWNGSEDVLIPGVGLSASPSAVVYNGRLFVFHQNASNGGEIWYTTTLDGVTWSVDEQIQSVGIGNGPSNQPDQLPTSPSAVVYNQLLYVFHQGLRSGGAGGAGGNNGELWYSVWDGTKWLPDEHIGGVGMSSSPSAIVYRGKLWVFHQGANNDGNLYHVVLDADWAVDEAVSGVAMSTSPSTLVFNDNLYVFHQGSGNNSQLWYSVWDGLGWGVDEQLFNVAMSSSPGSLAILP
jgi:hypothetical protein